MNGRGAGVAIRAVFFDVGETLVDESRMWRIWAEYLDVSFETFMAELEAVIARGEHHRRVFDRFRPNFDMAAAQRDLAAHGRLYRHQARDLYPDARECLTALRRDGLIVGIAGNQPRAARDELRAMNLDIDRITTSEHLGVEKPSPAFFTALASSCGLSAREIAYVGDRIDNDVLPAKVAGMAAVFIVRGSWGRIHARQRDADKADARVANLAEVPAAISALCGERGA